MRLFIIIFLLFFYNANAQKTEKIVFKSANPFALSDIITDLENQQEQEVFGKLTFPNDSFEREKYPLIIGVAGSLGWRKHHYEYMKMYQEIGFLFCVDRGVNLGGNIESRERAFEFSKYFMKKTLLKN